MSLVPYFPSVAPHCSGRIIRTWVARLSTVCLLSAAPAHAHRAGHSLASAKLDSVWCLCLASSFLWLFVPGKGCHHCGYAHRGDAIRVGGGG